MVLNREGKQLRCPSGHCFDVARSGYINLLQPQDRRSNEPGDTKAAVAARRRLHEGGVTQPLLSAVAEVLALSASDVVLDAGCGEGFYLGNLAGRTGCTAHGIDISVPAIEAAARLFPQCEWVVANADRILPYADCSFSAVMSITGRMNADEFRRVLRDDGRLLIALAAPGDLIELRGQGRDRVARTVEEFAGQFELVSRRTATHAVELDTEAMKDALLSIYRPMTATPSAAMQITFSLDLLLFKIKAPNVL